MGTYFRLILCPVSDMSDASCELCKRCANEVSRSDRAIDQTTEMINCPVAIDLNPVESIPSNRRVVPKPEIFRKQIRDDM